MSDKSTDKPTDKSNGKSIPIESKEPLVASLQWFPVTSSKTSLPDTFHRVQIIAYNKSLNQSVITTAMYEGQMYSSGRQEYHNRFSCLLLSEDKINWYTLDPSWEVTHWAYLLLPSTIQKINISKKVTEF